MEVHYKFKEARKSAGLTQKEVAAVVGVLIHIGRMAKLRLIANHWLNSQSYLVLLLISFLTKRLVKQLLILLMINLPYGVTKKNSLAYIIA